MGLILDTNIIIAAERNREQFDFNEWSKFGDIYLSSITVSELLVGVHLAKTQAIKMRRSAFVEYVINEIMTIGFNDAIARTHAELNAYLTKKGNNIGPHDLIIAATAIHVGFPILTKNVKEFSRVPGLELIEAETV